jgi:outer membrane receptor protein involved in Fe transport
MFSTGSAAAIRRGIAVAIAAASQLATAVKVEPAETLRVEGVVEDPSGHPVPAAAVTVTAGGRSEAASSDALGRFAVDWEGSLDATVLVQAAGFSSYSRLVKLSRDRPLRVVLRLAPFASEVTVTASKRSERLSDTAASVLVLSSESLSSAAAPNLDDTLRLVPGFSLFRRTGSRTANPTTQGVSLRGLAGSGASRALVLDDGLPLNDAFGGWIYWGRVPATALEQVEVLRGGASSLYGSGALAGVVQLVRRAGMESTLDGEASYGSQGTHQASAFGQTSRGPWRFRLTGESFGTEGYVPTAPAERGGVDTPTDSRHLSLDLTVERSPAPGSRLFARGTLYSEDRRNGTPLQRNDTDLRQAAAGWDQPVAAGALTVRAYLGHQDYHQTFSTIAGDRGSERLNRDQSVPSDWGGVNGQWTRAMGRQLLLFGADGVEVRGRSDERIIAATGAVTAALGAGRQRSAGLFAEDRATLSDRLVASAGARLDHWSTYDGRSVSGSISSQLPDRDETALSPRASLLFRASRTVSLTSSAYGAFRAPTLNELYRTFRVGNVVTLANEKLGAERLRGAEVGALLAARSGVSVRGTLFWTRVHDTIANVTLQTTPTLVTRQRRNLGRIRSRGIEMEAEARPTARITLSAAWLLADARVVSFAEDPTLEGLRVPQVPRHQASLRGRYGDDRWGFALQARWASPQFEDDQNRLDLGSLWSVDARGWTAVAHGLEAFVAAENLLDSRWDVGRTPARTLGPPRSVRAGFRLRLPARTARSS